MNFIDEKIEDYSLNHSHPESDVLKKLNRETHANVLMPRMLSGHMQGNFLSMLSALIQPKNILEIGTYTGYSSICLAQGLVKGGSIDTIDINEELEEMANTYFKEAGLLGKIKIHIGKALDIIPTLKKKYDIVFIDADKINYPAYYDAIFDKVNKGGYIIADNVLWSGKVVDDPKTMDPDTKAIDMFNKKVKGDKRVEATLLPLRDGIMIVRKC